MEDEFMMGLWLGVVIGAAVLFFLLYASTRHFIYLNEETVQDICVNLTGQKAVEAKAENGKLICEVPSYDSTTNIIVRPAGQEDRP